jgi:hypothetical protein
VGFVVDGETVKMERIVERRKSFKDPRAEQSRAGEERRVE